MKQVFQVLYKHGTPWQSQLKETLLCTPPRRIKTEIIRSKQVIIDSGPQQSHTAELVLDFIGCYRRVQTFMEQVKAYIFLPKFM